MLKLIIERRSIMELRKKEYMPRLIDKKIEKYLKLLKEILNDKKA